MPKIGSGKDILLSALMLGSLAGCQEAATDPLAELSDVADSDIYGVDGYETVDGIEFTSAQAMFDRYARGEIGCWEFNFADNSCTDIFYSRMVLPNSIEFDSYIIEVGYRVKQLFPSNLEIKGKFLCSTITEEHIEARTAFNTLDRSAKITTADYSLEPETLANWRDSMRRTGASTLGIERCYRYSPVLENGIPVPGGYHVYTYIQGVMQPQREQIMLSMFNGAELDNLQLRPYE